MSRNKNQSLDFNSFVNITNNVNSIGGNKMNYINDNQSNNNNNLYTTQYRVYNNGYSGTIINNNKNRYSQKIKLTNNALFRSMKLINNNYYNNNKKHYH